MQFGEGKVMQSILEYVLVALVASFVALIIAYWQLARLIAGQVFLSMKQEILSITMCIEEINSSVKSQYYPPQQLTQLRQEIVRLETKQKEITFNLRSKRERRKVYWDALTKGMRQRFKEYGARKKGKK
jgi:hypothetical protein